MKNFALTFLWFGFLWSMGQGGTNTAVANDSTRQPDEVTDTEDVQTLWDQANEAYSNEDYTTAIDYYDSILEHGKHSSALYFNLGNAHYKINEIGPSIYFYEKALMLNPDDAEIKTNLAFAERMRMDQIESLPSSDTGTLFSEVISSLSVDEWAYLGLVSLLLAVLFFILYRYTVPTIRKRIFFVISVVLLFLFVVCTIAAFYGKNYMEERDFAIVMEEEIIARDEPKNSSSSPFTLHEGTKVELMEDFGDWTKIVLSNGSRAWLPKASFREL